MHTPFRRAATASLALLAGATVLAGAWGTSPGGAATPQEPTAATAKAAVASWFSQTNIAVTQHKYSLIPKITTGSAEALYKYAESLHAKLSGTLVLNNLTIVLPCQSTPKGVFVAEADTNVFDLGTWSSAVAMVFVKQATSYVLAALVNAPSSTATWPVLCTTGHASPAGTLAINKAPALLGTALTRDVNAGPGDASAVAPFALTPETDLYATVHEPAQDTAAGEIWTETFSAGSGVIYSFPLAAGGSWLIAPMRQTVAVSVPKGLTSTTYPDGTKVGVPHAPKVIHKAFYADTETAGIVDPAPGGVPSDDGFTGFPSSATAS